MKFQVPSANDSPSTWQEYFKTYSQHLIDLRGKLPDHVLELAELQGIDDGLIVEAIHKNEERIFQLILRCGYMQMGYYDLILNYEEPEISVNDEQIMKQIWENQFDLVRFELDITNSDEIEHRFEFHASQISKSWFSIRCRRLTWEVVKRANRNLN